VSPNFIFRSLPIQQKVKSSKKSGDCDPNFLLYRNHCSFQSSNLSQAVPRSSCDQTDEEDYDNNDDEQIENASQNCCDSSKPQYREDDEQNQDHYD
jgi:hypothetical protein